MWIVLFMSALCFHVAVSVCPDNWLTVNITGNPGKTCFRIYTNQYQSFDAAAAQCQNVGGYLARDTSQNVHNALKPNLVASARVHHGNFWIGLTDNNTNNGPWLWVGGSNLGNYTAWSQSNVIKTPNKKDCVYVTVSNDNFKWQPTSNCAQTIFYICQRDFNTTLPVTTTVRPLYCPNGWYGFASQDWCIKLFTTPASWTAARMQCRQNQADLVTINNTALNSFITSLVSTDKSVYWIGLNDRTKEGTFSWLDSTSKANYTFWESGMPNNNGGNENCVVVDGNKNYKWDDLDCSIANRYICQRVPFPGFPPFNTASTPSNQNCGFGWEDVTGSDTCLSFNVNVLTWMDARVQCQNRGGDLASVANIQEQTYISARSASSAADMFWIAANDRNTEGGWEWSDGTPFAYLNWGDRQPDNKDNSDCAVMVQKTGKWDDVPCQSRNGYICKKKGRVTQASLVTTTTPPPHVSIGFIWSCPRGWDNYRGSCYKMVQLSTGIDWNTASAQCTSPSMQSALAAIIDADENKFVFSLIPKGYHGYVWIGLEDPVENTFQWVDNTPVQYTNWAIGEPNNFNNEDCGTMTADSGKWNDANCAWLITSYVCKKSKSILPQSGAAEEQGCANGSIGYGAQCYTFIASGKSFYDAQKDCRSRSQNQGNLATVDSGHLQAFLTAELVTSLGFAYWIGLQQNNDVYKWQDPVPVSFTYWDQSHTGNERGTCVAMRMSGLWANFPCNQANISYICESPRPGFTTPTTRPTVPQILPCPKNWTGYNSLCYKVFSVNMSDSLTWGDARDYCASQATGGSLVTVNDNNTQAWLISNLITPANVSGHFWIGLNDRDAESSYVWVDNSPFLYSNWAQGEPNDQQNREDCVEWVLPQNYWNDDYCYVSKNWICEVPRGSIVTTPKPVPTGVYSSQCGNSSWLQSGSYCYFVSAPDLSTATWFDARSICLNLGAELASIGGEDENGFITSLISKSPVHSFWIGLNDLDQNTYGWTDNSPVSFINWALNEPNDNYGGERCVEIRSSGSWNDNQCQTQFGYVCKKLPGNAVVTPYITPPITGGCPRGDFVSLPSLGYCYYVGGLTRSTQRNFTDALSQCELMVHKSTLASVHSSLEEKYILTLTADVRSPVWIGLNDRRINNNFEWVDNLAVTYTNWGPGQPNENAHDPRPEARQDCVDIEIWRNQGTWNDRSCATPQAYICESKKGATFPTAAPNTTGCNAGYQRYHSSCYKFYRDYDNWQLAQNICQGDGGNLVTINSGVEQAFVEILTGHVNDSLQFWIGLKYDSVSASFHWADNWSVRFTNWGHGEPNIGGSQSCVTHMVDGQWQVVDCNAKHSFVCEINFASPPPSRSYNNAGRCPNNFNWFPNAGNCYYIGTNSPKSWAAANALCVSMGANLASIHSDSEARMLTNYIGNLGKDVWIGLFKGQGNGFSWYDGTQTEYLNWGYGEPSDPDSTLHQDCVKIQSNDGSWADTNCFDQNAYICKTPQVYPNGTTAQTGTGPTPGNQPQTGNKNNSSLSGGSVAGIVIGTLALVALVAVGVFFGFRYKQGQGHVRQPLTPYESGIENVAYNKSEEAKVKFSEA